MFVRVKSERELVGEMPQDLFEEPAYAVVEAGEAGLRPLWQAVRKGRPELLGMD